MNQWKNIWAKRTDSINVTDDVFDMFCKLKSADGFDVQTSDNYYEKMLKQWSDMYAFILKKCYEPIQSVYEVGCGSGVNLYLFRQLEQVSTLGGIDYSSNLITVARKVLKLSDLICDEALNLPDLPKYDLVLSDSVFQYFENADYGMNVLEKMYQKAKKAIVVTELHDEARREEHLAYRRSLVDNYDERYKGLEKTYYSKEAFIRFAEERGCLFEFVKPKNDAYWNNDFVYDFYMFLGTVQN